MSGSTERRSSDRGPGLRRIAAIAARAGVTLGLLAVVPVAAAEVDFDNLPGPPEWSDLPDWSGVWAEVGNTIFDHASVRPAGGSAGRPGVREYPPLTDEWEAVYARNNELVARGLFPDPVSTCGMPVGFPRIFNLPDVMEFVVRPEQTWIISENGPNVMRIYTDGRGHPPPEDLWLTYSGDSVGYWEGETLVFSTIAVKNEGTILDRTGLTLSDEMTAVTRIRQVKEDLLEVEMLLEDPIALKEPWRVVSQFERLPNGTRVYDFACAENNRNPVTSDGRTITLGADGQPLDDLAE